MAEDLGISSSSFSGDASSLAPWFSTHNTNNLGKPHDVFEHEIKTGHQNEEKDSPGQTKHQKGPGAQIAGQDYPTSS